MKRRVIICGAALFAVLLAGTLGYCLYLRHPRIGQYSTIDREPKIYPDYTSVVIPPNIAPLNFMVEESGTYYFARIYSEKGEAINVYSRSPNIVIPANAWHSLLGSNRGGQVHFDVFLRTDKQQWVCFATITNKIANEDIDGFLVYRRMHPTHYPIMGRFGIYQLNLGNFDEKPVIDNRSYEAGCVNCHSFCCNRTDKVLMGFRIKDGEQSTLFIEKDKVSKIRTKFGYTTWHPSGRLAIYSINDLPLVFHTTRREVLDTVDIDSTLAYFVVDSKTIRTSPEISRKDQLETWPAWSGDGRYLYFCSTPLTWTKQTKLPPDGFDKIKYDLVRISYDIDNDKWGRVETVLSAQDTGRSIAMPRISPDGRWLLFCMCDYGYFPPWQQSSDLYIMDLKAAEETGRYVYRRLDISSNESEAWHSWSSNSRWIVFSSRREHGNITRSYISYVDDRGKVYKPLIVPREDPAFYSYCLDAFNTPEFAAEPMPVIGGKLERVIRGSAGVSLEMPITMATPRVKTEQQKGIQ